MHDKSITGTKGLTRPAPPRKVSRAGPRLRGVAIRAERRRRCMGRRCETSRSRCDGVVLLVSYRRATSTPPGASYAKAGARGSTPRQESPGAKFLVMECKVVGVLGRSREAPLHRLGSVLDSTPRRRRRLSRVGNRGRELAVFHRGRWVYRHPEGAHGWASMPSLWWAVVVNELLSAMIGYAQEGGARTPRVRLRIQRPIASR